MKATIDAEGYLKIEVGSIVESLSDADLRTFAKYTVFQDHLLRGVCDALASGQMWADEESSPWWFGGDTFNNLRLRIATLMPEITAEAARHLERETRQARAERDIWRSACWALEQEWPERRDLRRTCDGEYHRPMSREEATAYLRKIEGQIESRRDEVEQMRAVVEAAVRYTTEDAIEDSAELDAAVAAYLTVKRRTP